jgi:hypothetical protein
MPIKLRVAVECKIVPYVYININTIMCSMYLIFPKRNKETFSRVW